MFKNIHPFNSALECGLRVLIILDEAFPRQHDLQTLVLFDYLLVHSGDANGPESIHPATPHRSGEVLVKRQLLEQGINLFISRGLIEKHYSSSGITFVASELSTPFIDDLISSYVSDLKSRASWVISTFATMHFDTLENYFRQNLDRWGGEFEKEALLKYVNYE